MKRTRLRRRRGQMEMVGLVVIVILITLGMLFFIQFNLSRDVEKDIFTRKGLAYSSVNALMKTTVDPAASCNPYSFFGSSDYTLELGADILEDCALYSHTWDSVNGAFGSSNLRCDEKHSCDYFVETSSFLLSETMGVWHKRYQLDVALIRSGTAEHLFNISSSLGGCPATRERDTSGLYPLSTQAGLVQAVLYVC